jgi:uncharacterized protein
MTMIRVLNRTRGTVLGDRVRLADDLPRRVRGFLFRPPPAAGEGILLSPCRAVHMFGVGFSLDVVFISENGHVVATYRDLAPWRRSRLHGSALHALELPAGTIRATDTAVGDVLSWTAVEEGFAETSETGETGEAPAEDPPKPPPALEVVEPASPAVAARAAAESSKGRRRRA